MNTLHFKKRFLSKREATDQMYRLRRHGIDAFRRGAVCTALLYGDVVPNPEFLHVFAGDWKMVEVEETQ